MNSIINNYSSKSQRFDDLFQEGISFIQNLSGEKWTDYNYHDPGITILEQLCFAITDLGYKSNFSIEDLLMLGVNDFDFESKNLFIPPNKIFSSNPCTFNDYRILIITQAGEYRLYPFDLNIHFADDMIHIEKWNPDKPMSVIYWDGDKEYYYVKRFLLEDSDKPVVFISEHPKSHLEIASTDWKPVVNLQFDGRVNKRDNEEVVLEEFIAVKGMKALGNRLTTYKVKSIDVLDSIPFEPEPTPEPEVKEEVIAEETVPETKEEAPKADANSGEDKKPPPPPKSIDDDGQASLF